VRKSDALIANYFQPPTPITYEITFVDATPIETATFTMILGRVMMDARQSEGMYKERITPSQGEYTPRRNSKVTKAQMQHVNADEFDSVNRHGTRKRTALSM
jgi:hypothetical protein